MDFIVFENLATAYIIGFFMMAFLLFININSLDDIFGKLDTSKVSFILFLWPFCLIILSVVGCTRILKFLIKGKNNEFRNRYFKR